MIITYIWKKKNKISQTTNQILTFYFPILKFKKKVDVLQTYDAFQMNQMTHVRQDLQEVASIAIRTPMTTIQIVNRLPPGNQTWQWKIPYPLKWRL